MLQIVEERRPGAIDIVETEAIHPLLDRNGSIRCDLAFIGNPSFKVTVDVRIL